MRSPKGRRPHESGAENKVISIVDELQRRRLAQVRTRASAMHLRELESSLDLIDHTTALKDMDMDAELAKLGPLTAEEARLPRAQVRAARALQSCLRDDPEAGFAEWAEVIAEVPELAHTYLVRARWLMQADPVAALADYDRAATAEPSNAAAYWRRADCYLALGDQDRALANYRRALTLDASLFDVHHAMGKIFAARGEYTEAVSAYDRALSLAPQYVDFYLGRAQALEHLHDYEGALRDHGKILELDPSRDDVRFYRVICHHHAGHLDQAIAEMERLIEREGDDHHNHRILGKLRLEVGQQAPAIAALTRALELAPDEAVTYAHRGRALWESGEHEPALADFDRAVALAPTEPELHLGRAKVCASLDRLEDALSCTSRAIELCPDHAFAHAMRAVYRSHLESELCCAAVEADLDRAVELAPDDPSFRRQRGEYLMEISRYAEALADFEKAIAAAPLSPSLYYDRGFCKSRLTEERWDHDEDYEENDEDEKVRCTSAIADFERAIALGLCTEDLYSELWNAHCQIQDAAGQIAALDRGCTALPESALLFFYRHQQRRSHGDVEGAAADRARAIELGFQFRDD
jgi:tetratricopeptide (TPR) repeat protein